MAKKANKATKLHQGKKLEAQKPLRRAHTDISITKVVGKRST
jgi:hypothetical protein